MPNKYSNSQINKNTKYLINNKFTKSIQAFNDEKYRRFLKFMTSPYYINPNSIAYRLFIIVMDYYPHFQAATFTRTHIYGQLFPKKKFNSKKLIDSFSQLNLLIEKFLFIEFLTKKEFRYHHQKAALSYQQGNFKASTKEATKALEKWEEEPKSNVSYEQLSLYQYMHYHPYTEKTSLTDSYLTDANQLTDEIFVLNKLRYYCESLATKSIATRKFVLTFSEEVLTIAAAVKANNSLINLYYKLVRLWQTEENEDEFITTQKLFFELSSQINAFESNIILTILFNYSSFYYFKKKAAYLPHQYELHKFGLANKLYLLNGYLPHTTFMNIIITTAGFKKFEEADKILHTYAPMIKSPFRNNSKQLALAYIHFFKEEYTEANQRLLILKEKSIYFSLRARLLLLRCNFEFLQKDFSYRQTFLSKCQSFNNFITNHPKIPPARKISYLNHLSILKKIGLALKINYITKQKKEAITAEIHETTSLVGWNYLLEKLQKIKVK